MAFSLRPAYYIGQLLYFELNIDYIIETYCVNKQKPQLQCNGKCHLAKQLQVISIEENSESNQPVSVVFEAFFPVFIPTSIAHSYIFFNEIHYKKQSFLYKNNYSHLLEFHLEKPPAV